MICPICHGSGTVLVVTPLPEPLSKRFRRCLACEGTGVDESGRIGPSEIGPGARIGTKETP